MVKKGDWVRIRGEDKLYTVCAVRKTRYGVTDVLLDDGRQVSDHRLRVVGRPRSLRGRDGITKRQAEALVGALERIRDKLGDEPIAVAHNGTTWRGTRQQASNVYSLLTGVPLFPDLDAHVRRSRRCPKVWDVTRTADDAMRLYGHPLHAANILRRQLEWVRAYPEAQTGSAQTARLQRVIDVLRARARGETCCTSYPWYSGRYALDVELRKIGTPLAPAGSLIVPALREGR